MRATPRQYSSGNAAFGWPGRRMSTNWIANPTIVHGSTAISRSTMRISPGILPRPALRRPVLQHRTQVDQDRLRVGDQMLAHHLHPVSHILHLGRVVAQQLALDKGKARDQQLAPQIRCRVQRHPPRHPLLPYLESLVREVPKRWDNKLKKYTVNDDWLLWDLDGTTTKAGGTTVSDVHPQTGL